MLVGDELAGGWPSALITRRERQRTYRAPLALLGFGRGRSANNDLFAQMPNPNGFTCYTATETVALPGDGAPRGIALISRPL